LTIFSSSKLLERKHFQHTVPKRQIFAHVLSSTWAKIKAHRHYKKISALRPDKRLRRLVSSLSEAHYKNLESVCLIYDNVEGNTLDRACSQLFFHRRNSANAWAIVFTQIKNLARILFCFLPKIYQFWAKISCLDQKSYSKYSKILSEKNKNTSKERKQFFEGRIKTVRRREDQIKVIQIGNQKKVQRE